MTKRLEIHRGAEDGGGGGEKKKTLDQAEKFGERASGTKAVIRGARLMLMLQSPTELTGGGTRRQVIAAVPKAVRS